MLFFVLSNLTDFAHMRILFFWAFLGHCFLSLAGMALVFLLYLAENAHMATTYNFEIDILKKMFVLPKQ